LVQTLLQSDSAIGSYELPKFRDSNRDNFGTAFRESQEFVPFGCSLRHELQGDPLRGGRQYVAPLLWPSVGVKPNTWKSWELESSGTPECLELNSKGQNTLHWGILGVIGKVLKIKYRKCPRIGNSDICSPSYGQKKGRESNWQFDSRPLKVGNRPLPDVRFGSAIQR
jgi:hypothetical protein